MTPHSDPPDARLSASRYLVDRLAESAATADAHAEASTAAPANDAGSPTPEQRAAIIETTIQQAIRRGEFDDLPGAGKPLQDLGGVHDPDWWIRRKIEREQLTGLGPPALTLRTESASLDERLDGMSRETEVRDALDDFNRRVIEARRQLLGGPPVVTTTRDIDSELEAWRARREARRLEHLDRARREAERRASMTRRERRRYDRDR